MKTSNLLIILVLLAHASCVDKSFDTQEISVIKLLGRFNISDFNMLEGYVESLKDPIIMQQVERNGVTNY